MNQQEFCFTSHSAQSWQYRDRRKDYALLLFRMTSRVLYSAQYHRQHCTLKAFEQFGELYKYAQPRWQISGPTGIRTCYIQLGYKLQSIQMSHRGRRLNQQRVSESTVHSWYDQSVLFGEFNMIHHAILVNCLELRTKLESIFRLLIGWESAFQRAYDRPSNSLDRFNYESWRNMGLE